MWGHGIYGGGNDHAGGEYLPDGRSTYHQFTEEWTNILALKTEVSTSLAAAKPENTENNIRPEVKLFLPCQKPFIILTGLTIVKQSSRFELRRWL